MEAPTNTQIADVLEEIAEILDSQDTNPFRVRAYREGASTVRNLDRQVADIVRRGKSAELTDLPNIGERIAAVIEEYVSSGKSQLLENLKSESAPEDVFALVPGIGKALAKRIVEQLHIQTLEELEEAALDGRLESLEGFGTKRVKGISSALAGMLSRSARSKQRERSSGEDKHSEKREERPPVQLLLDLDAEYRKRSREGKLHKIAPRRFNPGLEAWLPVLHMKQDGWTFTLMFSNTAQAHKLVKTDDWVVIYYERDGQERQNTVVTETTGPLKGKRVVRGREAETQQYYSVAVAMKPNSASRT